MSGMPYLLRVRLPDRPGSLGALAVALGSVGADIISLDVVERVDGTAVDDIVVDVPSGTMPDVLITAAEGLQGVGVEGLRPFGGILDAGRELELVDTVTSSGRQAYEVLAERVPTALRVGWALVLELRDGAAAVLAAGSSAPGSPATLPAELCADAPAHTLDADRAPAEWTSMDTALAVAPLGVGRCLVVGRPGGPDFRPSEIARLGYFTGILTTVLPD